MALGVPAEDRKERNPPTKMELSTEPHIPLSEFFPGYICSQSCLTKRMGVHEGPVLAKDFSMVLSKAS